MCVRRRRCRASEIAPRTKLTFTYVYIRTQIRARRSQMILFYDYFYCTRLSHFLYALFIWLAFAYGKKYTSIYDSSCGCCCCCCWSSFHFDNIIMNFLERIINQMQLRIFILSFAFEEKLTYTNESSVVCFFSAVPLLASNYFFVCKMRVYDDDGQCEVNAHVYLNTVWYTT